MNKIFTDKGWEGFQEICRQDNKFVNRLFKVLDDIDSHPFIGIGKPEPLKGDWAGYWSRRIDEYHRLIYHIVDGEIVVVRCGKHYAD